MTTGMLGLPPPATAVARRGPSSVRVIWGAAVTAAAVVLVAILLAAVVAAAFGYRVLVIKSGSMTPTLHVGDLVVSRQLDPASARPGEIISFRDPYLDQQLVTHRVVSLSISKGQVRFVTKGDANSDAEHWSIPVDGTIGREVERIPFVGRFTSPLVSPVSWVIAFGLLAAWLAVIVLRRIWREDVPKAKTVRLRFR
ncbi:MAG TPA: signal peptidase I [Acidimicrobiales bacterium]|nr:signal peptidase I [Acidimicrobiales bacterium]